jgi:hypothetical protein
LMFARHPNHFQRHTVDASREPAKEEELLARIEHMASIVYPSIKEKVVEQHKQYQQYFKKRHRYKEFPAGSLVMVRNDTRSKKTEERFNGPFTVKRRTQGGSYILVDHTGTEFSRAPSQLKLIARGLHSVSKDVVKEIVDDRKTSTGSFDYLVKWSNQPDPTWVAAKDFDDYTPIREYFSRKEKQSLGQSQEITSLDDASPTRKNNETPQLRKNRTRSPKN